MLTHQREFIKWLLGVFATVAFVLAIVWVIEAQKPGSLANNQKEALLRMSFGAADGGRMPASVMPEKGHSHDGGIPSGKGSGGFTIQLKENGVSAPGSLNLKASVEVDADIQDVKYHWVLPEGVALQNGLIDGDLGALAADETTEFEASFVVPESSNKQIHLQVYSEVNGARLGDVVQYNSIHEEEIERSLASKRETLEADREAAGLEPQKISY